MTFFESTAAIIRIPRLSVRSVEQSDSSSSSTVQNHLNTLEIRGYITRDPAKSRTVEVVDAQASRGPSNIVHLPLVGRVAAGTPVLALENVEEHLNVGTEIAGGEDSYALTVHGESMIDAGICDGDIVVVRPATGGSGQRHHRRRPDRERDVR